MSRATRDTLPRGVDLLLGVASIGGALCILLVLLSAIFHVGLVLFRTGSMSPTIAAGDAAVVREVDASAVRVGDVVTVDRPGSLPVTHRITSTAPDPAGGTVLTLRGDANPVDDPAPYHVSTVRLVLFSIPGVAPGIAAMSSPALLGSLTIGVASLVTWAFWPRGGSAPATPPRPRGAPRAARHRAAPGALLLVGVAVAAASTLAPAGPAAAVEVEQTVVSHSLTVVSIADWDQLADLGPGITRTWQVGVVPHAAEPGTISVVMTGGGGLMSDATGIWLRVRSCGERWRDGLCASGELPEMAPFPASDRIPGGLDVAAFGTDVERWFLIEVALPADPDLADVGSAHLTLHARGSGDDLAVGTDATNLASTGGDLTVPIRLALAAVAGGLLLALLARLRRRAGIAP